ncbi:hypothetical protein JL721_8003 [Aureococcus anophagefferens]|nr:hypothetical protein JL721_8003 [Aureococcus anophagefferens]
MAGVVRGLARYFNGGGAPRNAVAALHDAVRAATAADGGLSVAGSAACEAVLAAMAAVDAADLGVGPGAWYADGDEPDFTCLSAPYGGLDPS